jgi:hypothetical protein
MCTTMHASHDRDGDIDVLVASYSDDCIRFLENDGAATPTFTINVVTTGADGAFTILGSDLDTDGDIE